MKQVLEGEFFNDTGFAGTISIDMPMLVERLKMSKQANVTAADAETVDGQMGMAIKLAEIACDRILEVDLVHVGSGKVIKSKEEFLCSSESSGLVYKLGSALLQGNLLGKKQGS